MNFDDFLGLVGEVLTVETPAGSDSFLDIGGSSLAALRVLARLEQQHGIRLAPDDFLACATLGDVAGLITEAEQEAGPQAEPGAGTPARHRTGEPVAAGLAQQWALDAERMDPDAPALQFQGAFRLTGALDVDALRAAMNDVHHHHDALRTKFVRAGRGDVMELTDVAASLLVEEHPLEEGAAEPGWRTRLEEFSQAPFPADGTERWRALLIRHEPESSTLCLAFDHRTADGWSLGVVLEDLATSYAARREAAEPDLPPAGSWFDYAELERTNLPQLLERALSHWRPRLPEEFADYPVELPGRLASPDLSEPHTLHRELPGTAARALDRQGRTPFAVATAALARAVSSATGATTVRILTSSANRAHPGHERTVGWFATGVFPTYRLSRDGDQEADLDEVTAESRAALTVGNLPAVDVRRGLWPDSPPGFRQDTGIYLACRDEVEDPFGLAGLSVEPVHTPDRADSPGVQMFLVRTADGWELTAYSHSGEYPTEVVDDLVTRLLDQLESLTDSTKEGSAS